jgi:glycosyltransferase involved in cell wall biosynthesis
VVCVTGKDVRLVTPALGDLPHRLVFSRHLDLPLGGGWLRRFTFRRVDAMLTNSDATRRTLLASLRGFPADRVIRVYNPMRLDALRTAPRGDLRASLGWNDAFVIGIAARLTAQKGHDILLDAFARVLEAAPEARLLVAGTGSLEGGLRARSERLGLADTCRFVGHVEPVAAVYHASDVTAVPSRFEGFCFSAVESEALGVPVVASNVSSLPEVVADGETGVLVPPGDPDALAAALLSLREDPARRTALGAAGPAFADRFAEKPMLDELERVLAGLTRR